MKSTATANWKGNLKQGSGIMNSTTKFFDNLPYTFTSRFVDGKGGTNPEELIAAAHAGCFSMALSSDLEKAGFKPEEVETTATVTVDNGTITTSHLVSKAKVPGISKEEFAKIAAGTKSNCPVSKALNVTISLEAALV
jgi:osmotically inducible protein OsmC